MNRLRDIKRAARLRLHADMGVAALYLPSQGATPVPCTVRVHTKFAALGDRFDGAERAEAEPKIIFLASEVPAPRSKTGIVSVEPGEAYRIEVVDPADDITVTATVTRLSATQAGGLPIPDNASMPPLIVASSHGYVVPAFVHVQEIAAAEWVIVHNLGRNPVVALVDEDGFVTDGTVQHVSVQQLRVSFNSPKRGEARLI